MPVFYTQKDKELLKRAEEDRLIEESKYAIEIHKDMDLWFWYVVFKGERQMRGFRDQPYNYAKMDCKHKREDAHEAARQWILTAIRQKLD